MPSWITCTSVCHFKLTKYSGLKVLLQLLTEGIQNLKFLERWIYGSCCNILLGENRIVNFVMGWTRRTMLVSCSVAYTSLRAGLTDGWQSCFLATEHVLNMSVNPVRPENCLMQCLLNKCFGLMDRNQADQEYKNTHTVIWTFRARPLTTSIVTLNVCNIEGATLRIKIE